jgi:nucleoside 2-deoxyribosyltransferase
MKIYLICPVRMATPETRKECDEYVAKLESEGHKVFYPPRDAQQDSSTILVQQELSAIDESDEVHIFWLGTSFGSHFDLGATMVLKKPIVLVKTYSEHTSHSYIDYILQYYNYTEVRTRLFHSNVY